ncbi:MAG: 30S ribosome-binding factor RbfA [Leptolyngbyaceae cyanobacterium CAN_BIN12]|nr:30S ribosome-binding factor RbfA [Leptolyngbyaceae cyanobacterium CAN_BIN12]
MATDRRVARVSELIRREVSQMLLTDIKDDRVGAGMVSVTDVIVAGDLQHAKIYVSVYGDSAAKAETMEGLKAATGFVRSELGQRISLRRTPEVTFLEDVGLERGDRVLTLLNQLSQERPPDDIEGKETTPTQLAAETDDEAQSNLYEDDEEDEFEDEEDEFEDKELADSQPAIKP